MTMMTVEGALGRCCVVAGMCKAFQQRAGRNGSHQGNNAAIVQTMRSASFRNFIRTRQKGTNTKVFFIFLNVSFMLKGAHMLEFWRLWESTLDNHARVSWITTPSLGRAFISKNNSCKHSQQKISEIFKKVQENVFVFFGLFYVSTN